MVRRTGLPCAIMFVDVCGTAERLQAVGNARAQADTAVLLTTLSDAVGPTFGSDDQNDRLSGHVCFSNSTPSRRRRG